MTQITPAAARDFIEDVVEFNDMNTSERVAGVNIKTIKWVCYNNNCIDITNRLNSMCFPRVLIAVIIEYY
jgi:hypothetical protein